MSARVSIRLGHAAAVSKLAEIQSPIVFDVSDRTQIEIRGNDRQSFLHGFCTNDIKSLHPGDGCEAFLTNIKGRILGHVFVFANDDHLCLETVPGQESVIIKHLDRYVITEDVQFVSRAATHGELFLTGPHIASLLMLDNELSPYASLVRTIDDDRIEIRRADILGGSGYFMSLPRGRMSTTLSSLVAVGCRAGTPEEFESRRIEAGFPTYGRDITEDNIAQEAARTKQCISFKKGCYLGQEPIARLDALGHTNRELRRIRFPGESAISAGCQLVACNSDEEAGQITSVASMLTATGELAALGWLKTKFGQPGAQVRVLGTTSPIIGTVLQT